jgi:hypothetical protein
VSAIPPEREAEARDLRVASWVRGLFIAALVLAYGWFVRDAQASMTGSFLVGLVLQVAIVVARRFVPAEVLPQAQYLFEMIADGVTVLMFALGVFGGIARLADSL